MPVIVKIIETETGVVAAMGYREEETERYWLQQFINLVSMRTEFQLGKMKTSGNTRW